jgi:hypothetical protein
MLSLIEMHKALVASILVHAAALCGARPIATRLADAVRPDPAALEPDRWTGTSIEVSTGTDGLPPASDPPAGPGTQNTGRSTQNPGQTEPSPPSPAPDSSAAPSTSAPPPTSAAPTEPAARPPAPSQTAQAPRPRRKKRPPPAASSSASAAASSAPAASGAPSASPAASSTAVAGPDPGTGSGNGSTFGSDGEAAKRDLGRAFTRAIPAACAADPVWSKLAAGDAGTLRVELRIDGDGHIAGADPVGADPPKHLVNILRRTVPMLSAGTFAVRSGSVTAGTQTLELKAVVSDEPDGDDGAGARDKLAFSYEGGRGKASFTQTGGRRVDVSVRVVSVKVD